VAVVDYRYELRRGDEVVATVWGAKTLFTPRQIRDLQAGR
jgi:hypothetical protein